MFCGDCLQFKMVRGWEKCKCLQGGHFYEVENKEKEFKFQTTDPQGHNILERGKTMVVLNPKDCKFFEDMND